MVNYSGYKTSKADNDRRGNRDRKITVQNDMSKIDDALMENDKEKLIALHRHLDGKYQSSIPNWEKGMWECEKENGFDYRYMGINELRENLELMKAKLEGEMFGLNDRNNANISAHSSDVSVTVNSTVNISVSFAEARQKIEDMTALSQAETDEIIEKINELEKISHESLSRKTQWEKVKPIISFVLDKGVDVVIAVLPMIIKILQGT